MYIEAWCFAMQIFFWFLKPPKNGSIKLSCHSHSTTTSWYTLIIIALQNLGCLTLIWHSLGFQASCWNVNLLVWLQMVCSASDWFPPTSNRFSVLFLWMNYWNHSKPPNTLGWHKLKGKKCATQDYWQCISSLSRNPLICSRYPRIQDL